MHDDESQYINWYKIGVLMKQNPELVFIPGESKAIS